MWLSKKWFSYAFLSLFNTITLSFARSFVRSMCPHCIMWCARICYCLLNICFHRFAHLHDKHEFNSMFFLIHDFVSFAFEIVDIESTSNEIQICSANFRLDRRSIGQPELKIFMNWSHMKNKWYAHFNMTFPTDCMNRSVRLLRYKLSIGITVLDTSYSLP